MSSEIELKRCTRETKPGARVLVLGGGPPKIGSVREPVQAEGGHWVLPIGSRVLGHYRLEHCYELPDSSLEELT